MVPPLLLYVRVKYSRLVVGNAVTFCRKSIGSLCTACAMDYLLFASRLNIVATNLFTSTHLRREKVWYEILLALTSFCKQRAALPASNTARAPNDPRPTPLVNV